MGQGQQHESERTMTTMQMLTDREVAAVIDVLAEYRDRRTREGHTSPIVHSALIKLAGLAGPNGVLLINNDPMPIDLNVAMDKIPSTVTRESQDA